MYYKLLPFKKGVTISCSLTFRCNLKCPYCTLGCSGKRVRSSVSSIEEWKHRIETFPVKIKEVYITGGEPTLVNWMPDFVNWLLNRGIFVTLYTNLCDINQISAIHSKHQFQILSTYHLSEYDNLYRSAYEIMKKYYRIKSTEISYTGQTVFDFSKPHPFTNEQELRKPMFRIGPDLTIHTSCWEMYHYEKYLT